MISEKYGDDCGSTSASGTIFWLAMVARSTYSARPSRPSSASTPRTLGKLRPSFMITAASASASRRLSSSAGSTPDSTDRLWLRYTSGAPSTEAPPSIEQTPGITSAS
ncbi:hypothetical protein D3C76_1648030 [compost metagenome]